jgi:hypothetical protein
LIALAKQALVIDPKAPERRANGKVLKSMEIPAFVCSHIFENTRPILLVSRADGEWQFLCGGTHNDDEIPRVIGLNHLLERDQTLRQILDLPADWEAERKDVTSSWLRINLKSGSQ